MGKIKVSEERLAANRANAKKAGRKPGSKNKATIIKEKAKERLDVAIAQESLKLVKQQMAIAYLGKDAPSAANSAIDSMLDRAFGRPTQREEHVGDFVREPITIVHIFADGRESSMTHGAIDVGRSPVNVTKHLNSYGKVEKRPNSLDQD